VLRQIGKGHNEEKLIFKQPLATTGLRDFDGIREEGGEKIGVV